MVMNKSNFFVQSQEAEENAQRLRGTSLLSLLPEISK